MRLVVWGQSKETDLIMVLWVTAFLPYGGGEQNRHRPTCRAGPQGLLVPSGSPAPSPPGRIGQGAFASFCLLEIPSVCLSVSDL